MRNDKPNPIVDKTFQYALKVLDYAEKLYEMKRFALADRLFVPVHQSAQMFGKHKMLRVS